MRVTPPQGGSAQGAAAPSQGPGPSAGGQPQQASPEAAIKMIQTGFEQLAKMIQSAQGQVDPQDVKLFQAAVQATGNFIDSMTGPEQGAKPVNQPPSQPMPANANAQAQPAPQMT